MLKSIQFKNFKILRDATLPLERFTLIVGPNGSGKSTAMQALQVLANPNQFVHQDFVTAGLSIKENSKVEIILRWMAPYDEIVTTIQPTPGVIRSPSYIQENGGPPSPEQQQILEERLSRIRVYTLEAAPIAVPVVLQPQMELASNGGSLVVVLDRLRDQEPERFEFLNEELGRWFPEFDRVLFDTPSTGQRAF